MGTCLRHKISILGSTGSIGKQALEVVESLNGMLEIHGLAAGDNVDALRKQIKKFNPEVVSVKSEAAAEGLQKEFPDIEVLYGDEGLTRIAENGINNTVLIAVTGIKGLFPTLAAINNGVDVALANKETLVAAGSIVMDRLKLSKSRILPVDSEHSAIFQCIQNCSPIKKLVITASGGPFRNKSKQDIERATVEETLSHPKWSMGDKITVDSATLMNKGLEVIEAHWLFGVEYKDIEVVIHPQSIIHSAVEFVDGSTIAQMGVPSMHIPIQYALTYPQRIEGLETGSLSLSKVRKLEFEEPDFDRFPCLRLAFDAGLKGGTYPAVLNAANEEAVYAFLDRKIALSDISKIVEKALEEHKMICRPSLNDILEADCWAREFVKENL